MVKIFGQRKLIRDISANAVQSIAVQLFGIIIFYFTSRYLSKEEFGDFNWSMATAATIIAVCSLGLDLVFVKKVASGEDVLVFTRLHLFHTVLVGICIAVVVAVWYVYPTIKGFQPIFAFVLIGLAFSNIANSFKLSLNGLEAYNTLAKITIVSNVVKVTLIVALYHFACFTAVYIAIGYIVVSIIELGYSYIKIRKKLESVVRPKLAILEYKYFILESLPQLGVVLFDSALARVDWILLGLMTSKSVTADYSFAYKIFEISKFPMLVIAPVLLTRFSKMFSRDHVFSEKQKTNINILFKFEIFSVMLIPIVLVCCWSPLIDLLTNSKYGTVNEINFTLLAVCIPLVCIINFLWTLSFVQGQLKTIMFITITVSLLNAVLNFILIPIYGGFGAALSFLFASIFQLVLYVIFTNQEVVQIQFKGVWIALFNAFAAVGLGKFFFDNDIFTTLAAVVLYMTLTILSGQISIKNISQLKQLVRE